MRENEVMEAVVKWLGSVIPTNIVHTEKMGIEVYEVENGYSIGYKMSCYIKIVCSEELTECYKNFGQCLTSCIENSFVPTYLAVPCDYPNIEKLKRVVNAINLPIGLITVKQNGEVDIAIKPIYPKL